MKLFKKGSITLLILILIYLAAIAIRIQVYENNRFAFFMPMTQESAFHYYFAKKIADGESIPAIDYNIQHPEGLKVFEATSVFMEYAAGYLYRLVRFISGIRPDFTAYISVFVPLFSCLAVFALYLTARLLLGDTDAALLSALLYAVLWPAVSRTIGVVFLRENFSLPFLFFFIYFFIKYLAAKRPSDILLSGLMFYIALASWHFTQFIYLAFLGYPALCAIFGDGEERVLRGHIVLACFALLAGASIPFLRANKFVFSPAMLVSYSIIAVTILRRSIKMTPVLRASILLALSGTLFFFLWPLSGDYNAYSHVYNLAISKLRFLGMKPYDPSLMPLEARQLWSFPFSSPTLRYLLHNFLLVALISMPVVIKNAGGFLRNRKDEVRSCLLYCLLMAFALQWFSIRLRVLLAFFIALYAGGSVLFAKRRSAKLIIQAVLLLCFLGLSHQTLSARIAPLSSLYEIDIFRWICLHTQEKSVILGTPFRSAQILAYTNRPVILHPKYETKAIRTKANEFNRALLARGEGDLHRLCEKWGADYLIIPKGIYLRDDDEAIRYIADDLGADKDVVAYKLEALPRQRKIFKGQGFIGLVEAGFVKPELEHFELIYRNKGYLVYQIR